MEQQQKLLIEKGADIEVRSDDEGFADSWYEATIVSIIPQIKTPPNNPTEESPNPIANNNCCYEVEYKTLLAEDEITPLKELVRINFIRPPFPTYPAAEFRLDYVVEAFHRDGWWIGVITKVISNKLFQVTFTKPPYHIQFPVSKLRLHLDWIDGKWIRPPPNKNLHQITNQLKSEKCLFKKRRKPAKLLEENDGPKNGLISDIIMRLSRKGKPLATGGQTGIHLSKRRRIQRTDLSIDNVSNEVINLEIEEEGTKEAYAVTEVGIAAGNHQSPCSSTSDSQPLSLWLARTCPDKTVDDLINSRTANRSDFAEQAVASAAAVEGNGGKVINPNNELDIIERAEEGNGGKIIDVNNQDLKMVDAANTAVEDNVIGPNNEKMGMKEQILAVEGNAFDFTDQTLPFAKTFPLWDQIESMQVFQAIPQRPHFHTLMDTCPENCREGMAIGYMVTFCSVVKKATELRLDDPRSSIADCIETLAKLEQNGFDVKLIHDRLNSFLSKKDEQNLLLDQLRDHENQIMEHICEMTKTAEEIDEHDRQIKELEAKCDATILMGKNMEYEIECIDSKLKSIHQEINNLLFDFKQTAGAPW